MVAGHNGSTTKAWRRALLGVLYSTGFSAGGQTTREDFLTNREDKQIQSYGNPASYLKDAGGAVIGDETNLAGTDNSYMTVPSSTYPFLTHTVQLVFTGTASASATEISVTLESQVNVDNIRERIEVYDRLTGGWLTVSDQVASNGTDATTILPIKNDPAQFIDPSTGTFKVRVRYQGGMGTPFTAKLDWLVWSYTGS